MKCLDFDWQINEFMVYCRSIQPNVCCTLFQKYLNTTPMEYVRQYRIEKGYQLLVRTNKCMVEISRECGMNCSCFLKDSGRNRTYAVGI